jgi:hypothetical protein
MSRTLRTALPIAAGALLAVLVLVLALGRGSGDDDKGSQHVASSGGPSSQPAAYTGPALPGLATTPVWSVAGDASTMLVSAVGSSLVITRPTGPETDRQTPMQLSFHDAATGAVRAQVETPVHTEPRPGHDGAHDIWVDSWSGRPALLVRHQQSEPSDGLTAEKRTDVVDAYGDDGAKLGSFSRPRSEDNFTVVNGWVVSTQRGSDPRVTVAGADGQERKTVRCFGLACAVSANIAEAPVMQVGSSKVPLVSGNLVIEPQAISGSSGVGPVRLTATDLSTGKQAWSTATMPRPEKATDESAVTGVHAMPLAAFGDKLLMSWYTDRGRGFGERGEILALHDVVTGKLLLTGPEMPRGTGPVVLDHNKQIAVVADSDREPHSVAWDLRDGHTLWTQAQDEKPLAGRVIAAGHLYGYRAFDLAGGGHAPIVVDVRTKAVSPETDLGGRLPVVAGTGQVAVATNEGVFVFAPA